ncbi:MULTISPECIES: hypothetical protein [Alphaproteobacteria]|uniref:Lipoprotein n=2 Tax=Alphaproteobacteria TaxID=28211 RepID=A0A512HHR0_9HYPH|nr:MULTISPECIES: hypothetical protein [Alphaproteobacteria]GEO84994.1 hypothetical protein RNA01_19260 [Ciceribacter naphthalenivorans]GLR22928.1 hypothetical protein GCM10007920_27160 [Ciceribacter naphthalenivorans]GLT05784.1 hypothetical protein GCM10007926_27160 [Sphingomonas psychrolutea]
MLARFFTLGFFVLLVGALASCSLLNGRPITRPLVYNVRDVTVIADQTVPKRIVAGVDRRVSAAITATRPPAGAERVVVMVRIDKLGYGFNARQRLRTARFSVTAVSIESGDPVATGSFSVNNPTDDPLMAEESLVEEIASRVRFAFSLASPSFRHLVRAPRTQTTRMKTALGPQGEAPVASHAPVAPVVEKTAEPSLPAPAAVTGTNVETNVEEGASAAVVLGQPKPVCDPNVENCPPSD